MTALALLAASTSYAAQSVRQGPHTLAPPSFDGHGWLVALNMGVMAWATTIAAMVLAYLIHEERRDDVGPLRSPARIWRTIGMIYATGVMLRCGVEAASIWGWDPSDPTGTARLLIAKRLVDPIAVACGVTGLGLYVLSGPGLAEQLRKEPLPIRMWQSREIAHRIGWLGLLSMIAAVGVVSTR
ncbi:hypothetical protein [Sphingomonas bacterium]|uniref:hypothetical protein n=1 Tax=Sphingomonas bacterium TaxID=1895847 RepID=UPI00157688C4|nr:hypothetical protein [Sphingomonas bacterium]